MAKRILCVIRTSTIRQEIESQHNDMIGFLVSKGYNEDEIEWLETKGASARCANKAYLKMLEDIKTIISSSETIKACAVWHLNRLGRIESYITSMREWFTNNHIQLYVKNPDITLLNADGTYNTGNNIVFAVFAATIPADTDEMMEKFKRGKARNKEQGKFNGGHIPFGFKVKDGYLIVDNDNMSIIRMIFEEYSTGNWSVNKLYKELNERGYNFNEAFINRILRDEKYKPYVDDLFDLCQEVMKGKDIGIKTKESKYNHLALKVLKCAKCGNHFVAYGNDNYKCYSKTKNLRSLQHIDCDSPSVSIKVMDTILYDIAMMAYKWQLENIDKEGIENLQKKNSILKLKIIQLKEDALKCQSKKERAIELYADAVIDKKKYQQLIDKALSELESIDNEVNRLGNEINWTTEQIELAKSPDVNAWFDLCINSTNELPVREVKELIRKYIKFASVDNIDFNGKKAVLILVVDSLGHEHRFIYNWNIGKLPIWTKKLMEVMQDGSIIPYLNSDEFTNRTEVRRIEYLRVKQLHN